MFINCNLSAKRAVNNRMSNGPNRKKLRPNREPMTGRTMQQPQFRGGGTTAYQNLLLRLYKQPDASATSHSGDAVKIPPQFMPKSNPPVVEEPMDEDPGFLAASTPDYQSLVKEVLQQEAADNEDEVMQDVPGVAGMVSAYNGPSATTGSRLLPKGAPETRPTRPDPMRRERNGTFSAAPSLWPPKAPVQHNRQLESRQIVNLMEHKNELTLASDHPPATTTNWPLASLQREAETCNDQENGEWPQPAAPNGHSSATLVSSNPTTHQHQHQHQRQHQHQPETRQDMTMAYASHGIAQSGHSGATPAHSNPTMHQYQHQHQHYQHQHQHQHQPEARHDAPTGYASHGITQNGHSSVTPANSTPTTHQHRHQHQGATRAHDDAMDRVPAESGHASAKTTNWLQQGISQAQRLREARLDQYNNDRRTSAAAPCHWSEKKHPQPLETQHRDTVMAEAGAGFAQNGHSSARPAKWPVASLQQQVDARRDQPMENFAPQRRRSTKKSTNWPLQSMIQQDNNDERRATTTTTHSHHQWPQNKQQEQQQLEAHRDVDMADNSNYGLAENGHSSTTFVHWPQTAPPQQTTTRQNAATSGRNHFPADYDPVPANWPPDFRQESTPRDTRMDQHHGSAENDCATTTQVNWPQGVAQQDKQPHGAHDVPKTADTGNQGLYKSQHWANSRPEGIPKISGMPTPGPFPLPANLQRTQAPGLPIMYDRVHGYDAGIFTWKVIDRLYTCDACGSASSHAQFIANHMRAHQAYLENNERACRPCGVYHGTDAAFQRHLNSVLHKQQHHFTEPWPENPLTCSTCQYAPFSTWHLYQFHMQTDRHKRMTRLKEHVDNHPLSVHYRKT